MDLFATRFQPRVGNQPGAHSNRLILCQTFFSRINQSGNFYLRHLGEARGRGSYDVASQILGCRHDLFTRIGCSPCGWKQISQDVPDKGFNCKKTCLLPVLPTRMEALTTGKSVTRKRINSC